MAWGSVTLIPGVNVERTPTLNQAGYSASSFIRFRDKLAQKIGGWVRYYANVLAGTPRDMHAWQDLSGNKYLSIGTTLSLSLLSNGTASDISPQILVSDFAPNFSTTSTSPTVTIVDPNISNVTTDDSVTFNTPVSVGGLILSGTYPIALVTGLNSYQITAADSATATIANGGAVPSFATTAGAATVSVTLPAHGLSVGKSVVFPIATTVGGVTIQGIYQATAIVSVDVFQIQVHVQAGRTTTASMNGGNAEIIYNIAIGPTAAGLGYGLGDYGIGGYGLGAYTGSSPIQTGSDLPADDWTSDNWGQIGVFCPQNGGIYYYDVGGNHLNAALVAQAPRYNTGVFVSTSAQILIAYGSSVKEAIGEQQDPLLVQWSDSGNFFQWTPGAGNLAGNFRIPLGSVIRCGMAFATANLIWTDLDLWLMNFIDFPDVYGFNKIGAGAGAISTHAAQQLRGGVYWMGASNFYVYDGSGVRVLPCPVWDAVFQNLNTAFAQNVRAMPNTNFDEVGWLYPSLNSVNGECDSFVKMNIVEEGHPWDRGMWPRSAWIDQSVLGPPMGATPGGLIYQHENGYDADGSPMAVSFTTGYFFIGEGEDFCFVDQVIPDFIYGTFAGGKTASIQITLNVVNFPGDTPETFGPYTVTQATQIVSTRLRGRQMSITVASNDLGSFYRLGRVRFRYGLIGRR